MIIKIIDNAMQTQEPYAINAKRVCGIAVNINIGINLFMLERLSEFSNILYKTIEKTIIESPTKNIIYGATSVKEIVYKRIKRTAPDKIQINKADFFDIFIMKTP